MMHAAVLKALRLAELLLSNTDPAGRRWCSEEEWPNVDQVNSLYAMFAKLVSHIPPN